MAARLVADSTMLFLTFLEIDEGIKLLKGCHLQRKGVVNGQLEETVWRSHQLMS